MAISWIKTHWLTKTKFYKVWVNMKARCYYKNWKDYKRYWARGIKVCDSWLKFENFYNDMYFSYKDGLTIERINNNWNYCKENCKWETRYKQAQNTIKVNFIEYNWVKKSLTQWAIFLWIKRKTLSQRINSYWWTIEKAFNKI